MTVYDFSGKVALVTGAGSGIGRASALAFAAAVAKVLVNDVDAQTNDETARMITAAGGDSIAFAADVRDESANESMVRAAVDQWGRLDCAHNNAGIAEPRVLTADLTEDIWDRVIDINLKGTFLTCKYAIPEMRKRGGGAIVNTASVQAFASQKTVPAYAASKGGVVSLTTTIALDHADDNIRCNCIAPGTIRTPMVDQAADTFGPEDHEGTIAAWGREARHRYSARLMPTPAITPASTPASSVTRMVASIAAKSGRE